MGASSSPPPSSSTPLPTYTVSATNIARSQTSLIPSNLPNAKSYTCDLSFSHKDLFSRRKSHSVVLKSASNESVIGVADIDLLNLSIPVHLCFGDPDTSTPNPKNDVVWEDLVCREKIKSNSYELSLSLGPRIGRKSFLWKRTHEVADARGVVEKLDFLNLKMVEKESERVVARFVHYPWMGWKRGRFEIVEVLGEEEEWLVCVLLSGMGVVEYLRKSGGWSF